MKRRKFIKSALVLVGSIPVVLDSKGLVSAPTAETSQPPSIYMVSTAHLDTQWLWTIQDTIREHLPNTFNGQFALLDTHPNYQFNFEGSFRYAMIKEYYPAAYERIKQFVAAGRWHVAGSSVDACDVNIPSPESLVRQILYGNGFFKDEFGKSSSDIFLPDCFGFGYALPTVAAHCNLNFFSTIKLGSGSILPQLPFDIGVWEGVDGSMVVAALNNGHYVDKIQGDVTEQREIQNQIRENGRDYDLPVSYRYFGVGDSGGAPTEETVNWLDKSMANHNGVRVICDSSTKMLEEMTPKQIARLPHYKGEFLLRTHGTGCYTSHTEMKRFNRRNEQLGDAAERAVAIAAWLGGMVYPKQELKESWIRFLWHQFHDDLTGTSIPEAYVFSQNDEILSLKQFSSMLTEGVGAISRALDTRADGTPVVVYNPLAIDREDVLKIHLEFEGEVPEAVRVFEKVSGLEVLSQVIARDDQGMDVLFLAVMPAIGFKVFDVRVADKPTTLSSGLKAGEKYLENEFYRMSLDDHGDIESIYDKKAQREMLSAPIRLEMLAQDTQTYFTSWEIHYADILRQPREYFDLPYKIGIVEDGPLRATLVVTRRTAGSDLTQLIHLSAGQCGSRIEIENELNWQTMHTLLKARFPLAVRNQMATYDLGMGTIERPTNSTNMYEVPAQQWADLTSSDDSYGVAIMNDCRYGWDKPTDNTLRLTLQHNQRNQSSTPPTSGDIFFQEYQDFGRNRFTFSIYGHKGDWQAANVAGQAARLNQPLLAFTVPKHTGSLGAQFSMIKISDPRIVVTAFKQAEKTGEFIIRIVNQSTGGIIGAQVRLATTISEVREVYGSEDPRCPATVTDGALVLDMIPYQPRCFAFLLESAPLQIGQINSIPVALPLKLNVVSADGQGVEGMDDQHRSFPRELFPSKIKYKGVEFEMGPPDGANAAIACGQVIQLPVGSGTKRLFVLTASSKGDLTEMMTINGKEHRRLYPDFSEMVGQADSCMINGQRTVGSGRLAPGYIKPEPVAWISTHLHNAKGENEIYKLGYLFVHVYELEGATSVTLPKDDRLRIMAMSVRTAENDEIQPLQGLQDSLFFD